MNDGTIKRIEEAIPYHINYIRNLTGQYLKRMDILAIGYSGSKSEKISSLLNIYYKVVGVSSLGEAITRLKRLNNE